MKPIYFVASCWLTSWIWLAIPSTIISNKLCHRYIFWFTVILCFVARYVIDPNYLPWFANTNIASMPITSPNLWQLMMVVHPQWWLSKHLSLTSLTPVSHWSFTVLALVTHSDLSQNSHWSPTGQEEEEDCDNY